MAGGFSPVMAVRYIDYYDGETLQGGKPRSVK